MLFWSFCRDFNGFQKQFYIIHKLFAKPLRILEFKRKKLPCPNLRLIFACVFVIMPLKLGVMNRLFINENNEKSIAAIVSFYMRFVAFSRLKEVS